MFNLYKKKMKSTTKNKKNVDVNKKSKDFSDVEIEKLKKQIELEKAKKPGYWELFASFYYKDDNAPLYCRKYARPDSWFKRPGTACLTPNGEWKIIK